MAVCVYKKVNINTQTDICIYVYIHMITYSGAYRVEDLLGGSRPQ